ncbi:MAG TPA: hypothetical protein VMW74_01365 [Nitrosopumilaceae archaeon]|nr:hypothetical protein [Nitrosopumilaceae archaeon]
MKVSPHGFGFTTKESSFRPIIYDEFRRKIIMGIRENQAQLHGLQIQAKAAPPRKTTSDISIPEEAGWTFLINSNHPLRNQIIDAIQPLAIHREMDRSRVPLLYDGQPEQFWTSWINDYRMLSRGSFREPPKYILIIGDPQSIPFGLQAKLSIVAFVGRLDFDDVNEIRTYAEKVIRIENSDTGFVNRETTFFTTDQGINSSGCYDPTHFNRFDVEKELIPNVDGLASKLELPNNFSANKLSESDATKNELQHSIKDSTPGLVLTSSWGMCAPGENMALQKEFGGAICCQGNPDKIPYKDLLFTAADVLPEPFLEGGVFIQQSSFSYGTPSSSELHNWISRDDNWQMPRQIAPTTFVSSLPKKLIFHPKGPLAFIGHLDEMLSYTIAEDEDFQMEDREKRMKSLSFVIENILRGTPIGYALKNMKEEYSLLNDAIVDVSGYLVNELNQGKDIEESKQKQFSDLMLQRHKTKNFMIFGDPAVRIKQWA